MVLAVTRSLLVLLAALFGAAGAGADCAKYDRGDWPHWNAGRVIGDRLDARQELLVERSLVPVVIECGGSLPAIQVESASYVVAEGPRRCHVTSGRWLCAYSGVEILASTADEVALRVTVEHVVPLAEAHRSGGACWSRERRVAFANDSRFLVIVERRRNSSRGDDDTYLPSHRPDRHVYLYLSAKRCYGLQFNYGEALFYLEQQLRSLEHHEGAFMDCADKGAAP